MEYTLTSVEDPVLGLEDRRCCRRVAEVQADGLDEKTEKKTRSGDDTLILLDY